MAKMNRTGKGIIAGFMDRVRGLGIWRINRKYKSNVFEIAFGRDREALLQLYNAMNGSNETDASKLTVVTLENAVYVSMKNDVAYIFSETLCLYEHQSSWNPNMPLRMLIYLTQEYQKYIETNDLKIYGKRQVSLPTPQCVVFYNGNECTEDEIKLRLSDSYSNKDVDPSLELEVKVLNINKGHNKKYMDACRKLSDYSEFIHLVRCNQGKGMSDTEAVVNAVDTCIDKGILKDVLVQNRAEVIGVLLDAVDIKEYKRYLKQEALEMGFEEGLEEGKKAGLKKGLEEGMQKGMEEGMQKGMEEGMQKGMEEGMQKGMEEGMQKGMEEGMQKGMEEGMQKGMEEGMQKAKIDIISKMLENGLPAEEISKYCDSSIEEIKQIMSSIKS